METGHLIPQKWGAKTEAVENELQEKQGTCPFLPIWQTTDLTPQSNMRVAKYSYLLFHLSSARISSHLLKSMMI